MKALLLERPGNPETLRVGDVPEPVPGAGQVRVQVEACGLNPVDYKTAAAGVAGWSWPHVLGLDVAGTVDALGADVADFEVGTRVAFHADLRRDGGYADYAVAEAITVARIPDGLDAARAAALPCAGMSAYQAVTRRLHLDANDTVLVTGGAGGVGGFAVQLAASLGARVIATASEHNIDYVRGLGAWQVIDYSAGDTEAQVRRLTDARGVDAVIDTVSADSANTNLGLLVHGGGLASVAARPDLNAAPLGIAPSIHEIALGAAHAHGDQRARADLATMLHELLTMVETGRLDPMLTGTVPLDAIPTALSELAQRHVRGKIVFTND